jgi:O-acetyl-ADP-ribose deacetylase (regulator of RNase III)
MINMNYVKGDILESPAYALVNPVNCRGTMGKGLAAQFKNAYPSMFEDYKEACSFGELKIGKLHLSYQRKHLIINFPTKIRWDEPSKLEYIKIGLVELRRYIMQLKIASIAIPALGCGLGGLQWEDVKPLIEEELASPNCFVSPVNEVPRWLNGEFDKKAMKNVSLNSTIYVFEPWL